MDIVLPPHITGTASTTVTQANTVQARGSGAVDALAPHLPPGMTTVGTRIDVQHLAATPVGMAVRAQATLRGQDGHTLIFDIVAHDDSEKIAEAVHQRVVVDQQRFLARANAKIGL